MPLPKWIYSGTPILAGAAFFGNSLMAAPCCGGSSQLPSLIAGDDRSQLSLLISRGSVIGDAPPQGIPVFRSSLDSESTETVRLDGAFIVVEGFQLGTSLPFVRRNRQLGESSASSQGLADLNLNIAYEFLPELSYSTWKPKGFLFVQTTIPTSPSIYDATSSYLLDARGRGFFSLALGTAFFKSLGSWDLFLSTEIHHSFSRTFSVRNEPDLLVKPGWGASVALGTGYSPGGGPFRVGIGVMPLYESAIFSQGSMESLSEFQLVWNTSLQASYALESDWTLQLTYTDQTLLGPAKNVSLSRTFAGLVQKRWAL